MKYLALLSLVALVGCGKFDRMEDGGFTRVSFNYRQASPHAAVLNGGVVIYAYSQNFTTNIKISSESAPASVTLPNGSYSFYAYGYVTNVGDFTGGVRCDVVGDPTQIGLDGSSKTISLNLTQAKCSSGQFFSDSTRWAISGTNEYFRGPRVSACDSSVNISSSAVGVSGCSSSSWGAVSALQAVVPLFKHQGGVYTRLGDAFRSSCTTPNTEAYPSFYVPVGKSTKAQYFPQEFEVFSNTACTGSPMARFTFEKSLLFGPVQGGTATAYTTTNTSPFHILLRQP